MCYVKIYHGLCPGQPLPRPRTAAVRRLLQPSHSAPSQRILDPSALVLLFPSPKSVTGEDVLEIHTHGGPAIVRSVLDAIPLTCIPETEASTRAFMRYAEPGEFTKRAFYNNRLDLTQAEALGEMLSAETDQQLRIAINAAGNQLGQRYEQWRNLLLNARGELEAFIDFAEDQSFDESPADFLASVSQQITALRNQVYLHIQNASKGELLRTGFRITLLGAPNAGKSSLLNIIAGREAAIVSTEAGTTRDVVDVNVNIGGWSCYFGDTAGLRKHIGSVLSAPNSGSVGAIEKEGMRRAKQRAATSDVVIILLSLERSSHDDVLHLHFDQELVREVRVCNKLEKTMLVVVNKTDQLDYRDKEPFIQKSRREIGQMFPFIQTENIYFSSCLQAHDASADSIDPGNIQAFLRGLQNLFVLLTRPSEISESKLGQSYWEQSLSVSHRQSGHLKSCLMHLDNFLTKLAWQDDIDIVAAAEDLRYAANELARITGKGESGDVEDVLGVVFEK